MRNRSAWLLFSVCTLLLAVLMVLPIGMVVRGGFWVEGRFTLRYLAGVFENPIYAEGLVNSLLIALVFLGLVIVVGESIASLVSKERYASLIQDSLVIGSWVALWRPLEIFLYDWWPISAEAKLFDRLSQMDVRISNATAAECDRVEGARA